MCSAKQHSSTNCHKDVATDGVREATQSHASESPVPGEGTMPERPGRRRTSRESLKPNVSVEVAALKLHKLARVLDVYGAPI
jgi:hypothetical protein